jgi:nucleoid-associated protein YgaU
VGPDGEADAATDNETDGLIVQSPDDVPALLPMQPVSRVALLARVKRALAGIPREPEASLSIVEMESSPTVVPARLEFNVNESRSVIREGEQIVLRIAVRNVGGEPAEGVAATLFFADGVEPMQAIGQSAEVYPGEVRFDSIDTLPPGDSFDLMVTAIGTRAGSVAYRGELECQQVPGGLTCEGAVTIRPRRQP